MTLTEYHDLEQRSDEWLDLRCGMVTASIVKNLVTPKTIKPASNDDTRALVALIAAERITGFADPTYTTADMWRGIDSEPYAVAKYEEHYGVQVATCGFMVREWDYKIGYSPDGLVGVDGLIEVKSPRQKNHLTTVVSGEVPAEHMAQIQTGLLVSGRVWCDYISFHGGMHMWVKRVTADERWFEAILTAVDAFEVDVWALTAKYEAAVAGFPMTERLPDPFEVELKL